VLPLVPLGLEAWRTVGHESVGLETLPASLTVAPVRLHFASNRVPVAAKSPLLRARHRSFAHQLRGLKAARLLVDGVDYGVLGIVCRQQAGELSCSREHSRFERANGLVVSADRVP
jgi:hypothetical protein